jgi:endonuclease I
MNQIRLLLLFSFPFTLLSQPPANYYNNANGLTGYQLKTALSNIITNGHLSKSYGSLYNGYKTTDTDIFYENDNSVLDIYSENPNGTDSYNYTHNNKTCGNYSGESDCYNREHLMPQSVFNSNSPMQSDIHFVIPTDGYVNGIRSSLPFGIVENATYTSSNGSKRGNNISNTKFVGNVFEPIDEFKGDIARCLLYVATRYESEVTSWNYQYVLNGTSNQVYTDWFLNLLLTWHVKDPVSAREVARNNACYNYQGNRNPFIDSAHYAHLIWGFPDTTKPSQPLNLTSTNITSNSVDLNWNSSFDTYGIEKYFIYANSSIPSTSSDTITKVTNLLPSTNYTFSVAAVDSSGLISKISDTVSITTLPNVGVYEKNLNADFKIFPNPTSNQLSIDLQNIDNNTTITIYNNIGVIIYQNKNTATKRLIINVTNIASGNYFIQLTSSSFTKTKPLIIQK